MRLAPQGGGEQRYRRRVRGEHVQVDALLALLDGHVGLQVNGKKESENQQTQRRAGGTELALTRRAAMAAMTVREG